MSLVLLLTACFFITSADHELRPPGGLVDDTGVGDTDADTDADSDTDTDTDTDSDTDTDTDTDTGLNPDIDNDGDGQTINEGDCDDTDDSRFLGNPEICNGVDSDCDGTVDNDAGDAQTFYEDNDGDTYGDDGSTVAACSAPAGFVSMGGDCNDGDEFIHPGAAEDCDGVDADCDGTYEGGVGSPERAGDTVDADCDGDLNDTFPSLSSDAAVVIYGEDNGDKLSEVGTADLDGDGFSDLLLATPNNHDGGDESVVHLFYGPFTNGVNAGDADAYLAFESNARGGYIADGIGDVDGDGREDIAIGAYNTSRGTGGVGGLFLFGQATSARLDGDLSHTSGPHYIAHVQGGSSGQADYRIGMRAAHVADATGNGDPDLLVTNHHTDDVYLFEGPLQGALDVSSAVTTFASDQGTQHTAEVEFIDVTGTGVPEVLVANYSYDTGGAVMVFEGPFGSASVVGFDDAIAKWSTAGPNDQTGRHFGDAGDLDDDGYHDVYIGSGGYDTAGENNAGAVFVVFGDGLSLADVDLDGGDADTTLYGPANGYLGYGPDAGDLDGDGVFEVVSGAYQTGVQTGAVFVWMGTDVAAGGTLEYTDAAYRIDGDDAADERFGHFTKVIPDADGDGFPDIAAVASDADDPMRGTQSNHGAVYVFRGPFL